MKIIDVDGHILDKENTSHRVRSLLLTFFSLKGKFRGHPLALAWQFASKSSSVAGQIPAVLQPAHRPRSIRFLLAAHLPVRRDDDVLVATGGPDIRQLLLAANVDVEVVVA